MNEIVKDEQLKAEIPQAIQVVNELAVTNADQYQYALDVEKSLSDLIKRVEEYWKPICENAHKAWKTTVSKRDEMLKPLKDGKTLSKRKRINYEEEEERKRQEEQKKLQAIADEKARKEREKLEKLAEQRKTPEVKERYREEAEQVEAPVVTVQSETPQAGHFSTKKKWKGRVINKVAALKHILDNPSLIHLATIDEKSLNDYAKSTKGEVSLPGIEFYVVKY